jgi:hypothetical protein
LCGVAVGFGTIERYVFVDAVAAAVNVVVGYAVDDATVLGAVVEPAVEKLEEVACVAAAG